MRALVTGASGFVGGAVARALLAKGVQVRALLRAGSNPNLPAKGEVEIARGDLRGQQRDGERRGGVGVLHRVEEFSHLIGIGEQLQLDRELHAYGIGTNHSRVKAEGGHSSVA